MHVAFTAMDSIKKFIKTYHQSIKDAACSILSSSGDVVGDVSKVVIALV